jgi:hypothetical protein
MTDDMEEQLRAVLRQRAGVPSASGDPVPAVQRRMRRRAVRRGAAVATTAAACVAGIAIGATALAGNDAAPLRVGPAVGPSIPAPAPSPPHNPQLSLPPLPSTPASSPVASAAVSPAPSTFTTPLPSNVSTVVLPNGYSFGGLALVSGRLVLVGAALPTPVTSGVRPACASARISSNPFGVSTPTTTINLTEPSPTDCADPASAGEQVSIVVNNPDGGSLAFTTSIAITVTDPKTGAQTTGPIVMRFSEASDTRPVAAYGGGSLWIYDVDTSNGPEAIQVSAASGKVEDVVRTPQFYRPIMAANNDGLWLGNSIEGGQLPGTLYHVAPTSHVVTTVLSSSNNDVVDWMVADAGHVWAGIRPAGSSLLSLSRFDGPTGKVALDVPEPSLEVGPNFVVGNEQDGLWLTTPDPPFGATAAPTDNQHLDVVRLDPRTGKPTVEAQLPPLDQVAAESGTTPDTAAFFAGDYFLLQTPSLGGYTGFTQLLRVTPLP